MTETQIDEKTKRQIQNEIKDKVINKLLEQVSLLFYKNKDLEKQISKLKQELTSTLKGIIHVKSKRMPDPNSFNKSFIYNNDTNCRSIDKYILTSNNSKHNSPKRKTSKSKSKIKPIPLKIINSNINNSSPGSSHKNRKNITIITEDAKLNKPMVDIALERTFQGKKTKEVCKTESRINLPFKHFNSEEESKGKNKLVLKNRMPSKQIIKRTITDVNKEGYLKRVNSYASPLNNYKHNCRARNMTSTKFNTNFVKSPSKNSLRNELSVNSLKNGQIKVNTNINIIYNNDPGLIIVKKNPPNKKSIVNQTNKMFSEYINQKQKLFSLQDE